MADIAPLFLQGAKLEIESILREVCDRIFGEPNVSKGKLELRAVALQILGEAYMGVKKDSIEPTSPGFGASTSGAAGMHLSTFHCMCNA